MIMKLELKHIVPYLPYELRLSHIESGSVHTMLRVDVFGGVNALNLKIIGEDAILKPLLRPISSITEEEALELLELCTETKCQDIRIAKDYPAILISGSTDEYKVVVFINHNRTHAKIYQDVHHYDVSLEYSAYEWLFSKHFDVFGLINKGLAADKTELK